MYPELMVIPMREELVRAGLQETRTAEDVDAALAQPGTTLLVVNSICGCAAGKMRPGVRLALTNSANLPDARSRSLPARTAKPPNAPAATLRAIHPVRPPSPSCATASWFT
jgi:putative YphP/YqiW family bacilliredoxin